MSKPHIPSTLILLAPLFLAACAENPMGDPVWSGWDQGGKAVSANDEAAQPTGSISPAATTGYGQTADGQPTHYSETSAPPAALESAPLPPPPGSAAAPADGPRADALSAPAQAGPDPYEPHYTYTNTPQRVSEASPAQGQAPAPVQASSKPVSIVPHPSAPVTQRTAPLSLAGQGTERTSAQ
jgi:hypothetical protein